jgi:hypothetical protein
MFPAQHQSKIMNLRITLSNTKKINLTTPDFLPKMESIVDDLAATGRHIPDDEMISYILASLGAGSNSLVAVIGLICSKMTLYEIYSDLQAYDEHM